MTDMRATERLLEVIEERVDLRIDRDADTDVPMADLNAIKDVITELRRRGDTLVRREDLMGTIEFLREVWPAEMLEDAYLKPMLDRLENAIGGKP